MPSHIVFQSKDRGRREDSSEDKQETKGQKLPKTALEKIEEKEKRDIGAKPGQPFDACLVELFDKPTSVLMKLKTFFPFDLFPDKISIDLIKITIGKNIFFSSSQIKNILMKDIVYVKTETSIFMATLKITEGRDKQNPYVIKPLKKDDAIKAGKIISRLVIGRSESLSFSAASFSSAAS